MAGGWLRHACRVYQTTVIAWAFVSLVTFAACYYPTVLMPKREFVRELVIVRAENVATLGALLLAFIGVAACVGCFSSQREPPAVLANYTLVAILIFVFTLLALPAIAT